MAWFSCSKTPGGGNSKDNIVTFNPAEKRENINSGEKHKTIFGKIAKYFSDLKPVAFTGSYNDLQDKPSNLAPAAHRHSKSDITDFPSSLPASDVYSWAKASSKPSYTAGEVGALPISGGTINGDVTLRGHITAGYSYLGTACFGNGSYITDATGKYCGAHICLQPAVNIGSRDYFIFDLHSSQKSAFYMYNDNSTELGKPYARWSQIYAVNGSISTSDRNQKKDISYIGQESQYKDTYMSDTQLVKFIMGLLPCIFKRTDGESGRPHHGIIAQDFEKLLKDVGIADHAAFIKSPKVIDIEEEIENEIKKEIPQEDGTVKIVPEMVKEKITRHEEIPGEYIYGIRYEELEGDIIRFCQILYQQNQEQQKKIEDLENRIKALESIIKQGA